MAMEFAVAVVAVVATGLWLAHRYARAKSRTVADEITPEMATGHPTTSATAGPPFEVGAQIFHPVHGLLKVVAITRELPQTLYEPSPIPVRIAVISVKEPRTVAATNFESGEVSVVPLQVKQGDEDAYVLEPSASPTRQLMVRVSEVLAWGARARPSAEIASAALEVLKKDASVNPNQPWAERYPTYLRRRQSLVSSTEVLRELCQIKGLREPSYGEKRFMDEITKGIVEELSMAMSRSKDDVQAELLELCHEQERMGAAKRPR
jgi:RNA polymerase-interacting CarD/CdnL/TRCF family regulator